MSSTSPFSTKFVGGIVAMEDFLEEVDKVLELDTPLKEVNEPLEVLDELVELEKPLKVVNEPLEDVDESMEKGQQKQQQQQQQQAQQPLAEVQELLVPLVGSEVRLDELEDAVRRRINIS